MRQQIITGFFIALVLNFASCEQKKGERCQWNDDCAEGLICCFDIGGTPGSDGICKTESECTGHDGYQDVTGETGRDDDFVEPDTNNNSETETTDNIDNFDYFEYIEWDRTDTEEYQSDDNAEKFE